MQATLNTLKAEMAAMPVVTVEMLKPDDMQQTYAAGVMLGRDMLNLQATTATGLKTDKPNSDGRNTRCAEQESSAE